MPVDVHFRGIMLYCCQKGLIDLVLLPDGEKTPPEGTGTGTAMEHLDKSRAALHYAGIHIPAQKTHHRFKNETVTITGGDGKSASSCSGLGSVARLNSQIWKVDKSHGCSEVIVRGASSVSTDYVPARKFQYLNNEVHDRVKFSFDGPITIRFGNRPIPVESGDVYVYNFDEPRPNETDLNEGDETDNDIIVDDDFKWVYAVVKPKSGKSRKEATGGHLPAPISEERADRFNMKTIFVSTCFPAVINTDE